MHLWKSNWFEDSLVERPKCHAGIGRLRLPLASMDSLQTRRSWTGKTFLLSRRLLDDILAVFTVFGDAGFDLRFEFRMFGNDLVRHFQG
jgi:hypothetical protein